MDNVFLNYFISDWRNKNAFELKNKRNELLYNIEDNILYRCFDDINSEKIKVSPIGVGAGGDNVVSFEERKDFFSLNEFIKYIEQGKNKEETKKNQGGNKEKSEANHFPNNKMIDFDRIENKEKTEDNLLIVKDKSEFIQEKTELIIKKLARKLDPAKDNHIFCLNDLIELQKKARSNFQNKDYKGQIDVYNKVKTIALKKKKQYEQTRKARIHLPEPKTPQEYLKLHKIVAKVLCDSKFIKKATDGKYRNFQSLPENMPRSFEKAISSLYILRPDGKPYKLGMLTDIANAIRQNAINKRNNQLNKIKLFVACVFILFGIIAYFMYDSSEPIIKETSNTNKIITYDSLQIATFVNKYNDKTKKNLTKWHIGYISKNLAQKPVSNIYISIDSLVKIKKFNNNEKKNN